MNSSCLVFRVMCFIIYKEQYHRVWLIGVQANGVAEEAAGPPLSPPLCPPPKFHTSKDSYLSLTKTSEPLRWPSASCSFSGDPYLSWNSLSLCSPCPSPPCAPWPVTYANYDHLHSGRPQDGSRQQQSCDSPPVLRLLRALATPLFLLHHPCALSLLEQQFDLGGWFRCIASKDWTWKGMSSFDLHGLRFVDVPYTLLATGRQLSSTLWEPNLNKWSGLCETSVLCRQILHRWVMEAVAIRMLSKVMEPALSCLVCYHSLPKALQRPSDPCMVTHENPPDIDIDNATGTYISR